MKNNIYLLFGYILFFCGFILVNVSSPNYKLVFSLAILFNLGAMLLFLFVLNKSHSKKAKGLYIISIMLSLTLLLYSLIGFIEE